MQLFILAYNPGNLRRRLTLPKVVKGWPLQSVPLRLIKTGARLVRHARRLVFQMAAVAVPGDVWAGSVGAPQLLAFGARMTLRFWKKQGEVTVKQERYVLAPLEDDRLEPQGVIRDGQRAQHGVPGIGTAATIALATARGVVGVPFGTHRRHLRA